MHNQDSSSSIQEMTDNHSPLLYFWEQVIKFLSLISLVIFVVGLFYKVGYLKAFQLTFNEFPSPAEMTFARGALTFIDYSNYDFIKIISLILICIIWIFTIRKTSPSTARKMIMGFFTLILLGSIASISTTIGISAAKKDQDGLGKTNNYKMDIISSRLNDGPYLRVACNLTHCAYWNKKGTLILRHDQVDQTLLLSPTEAKKS